MLTFPNLFIIADCWTVVKDTVLGIYAQFFRALKSPLAGAPLSIIFVGEGLVLDLGIEFASASGLHLTNANVFALSGEVSVLGGSLEGSFAALLTLD